MYDLLNHQYDSRILEELPGTESSGILYFPGATPTGGHDGLIVEVKPLNAAPWIGIFAFDDFGASGLYSTPKDTDLCVVARGKGFIVDTYNPSNWLNLPVLPINGVFQIPAKNLLILHDFTDICAWGRNGVFWSRDRLASDELQIVKLDDNYISGTAIKYGRPISFTISTETGKTVVEHTSP